MVGAGWLVLMDDWLGRSGPLGAILGFALGGILLLPSATFMAMGAAASERRRRGRLHRSGISAGRELLHWLDDAAGVLHRVPWEAVAVGKLAAYIFPSLEFVRIVSCCGASPFSCRVCSWGSDSRFSCSSQLPGHSLERQFSELDDGDGPPSLRHPLVHQRRSWRSCQFSSRISHDSLHSILLTLQIVPYS